MLVRGAGAVYSDVIRQVVERGQNAPKKIVTIAPHAFFLADSQNRCVVLPAPRNRDLTSPERL
jgi:hypothetical protein